MRAVSFRRAIGVPAAALLALGGATLAIVGTGSPAGATTTVHNATELQNAFNSDETSIVLANDIAVTSAITRDNTHNAAVIVDGGGFTITSDGSDRIFTDDGSGKLTLQDVTLTGGSISSDGGAVFAAGDVTVSGATFTGNHASDGYGGAIWSDGNVTADASTFDANVAYASGGAIAASGDVTVKNGSTFTRNTTEDNGGAVYSEEGLVDISDSQFTDNQADSNIGGYGDGGAAFSYGDMKVAGSHFTGNFTTGNQDFGGGAVEAWGSLDISDSQFTGNSANYVGGAAYGEGDTNIERSTFTGNCAQYGGAIEHNIGEGEGSAALTITNSTITANTQSQGDSSIGAFGASLDLAYSTVVGNINDDTATCGLPVGSEATATDHRDSQARDASTHPRAQAGFDEAANVLGAGSTTLFGNVITGAVGGQNCDFEGATSQGYNWSDDTTCDLTDSTDSAATPNAPGLNALGDWGGPTQTMLPLTPLHGGSTSPLIDAIPAAACQTGIASGISTDQRGITRPQLVGCDIGAVEVTGAEVEAAEVVAPPVVIEPKFTG
jgi:predicted outer membrane repeat protein